MDFAQLQTFVAAAESGSFSAAANIVHASTSSVTERIAALEHRIGARLFERSRKGCVLTEAGARFLPRAQAMLSSWANARDEARLPARFTGQLRIGGQYALWPEFLIPWIDRLRNESPQLAFDLRAGASARLNREVAAGTVDFAVLYLPVIGAAVEAREVVNDRLVLVCSARVGDWRKAWVEIDWGEAMRGPIAEATGYLDSGGVTLDLGGMALRWLVEQEAAGYLPERLARRAIEEGSLRQIDDMPAFDFPGYAIWRRDNRFDMDVIARNLSAFVDETDNLKAPTTGMDAEDTAR
ncbi:LysR family transcriptional regulator [Qipengyuania aquimaris]|uniref:LysR family transcriptional regulator n=1 Tax=Qipengyuania aquimaris TaxID=255984 RepID=UPI001C959CDA|nr:LysR family transcriptional regulator [Qipengyuania aquimaris]MBY6127211.1 LysR family transcriptional regulator [Qipengyuania aquimaris]